MYVVSILVGRIFYYVLYKYTCRYYKIATEIMQYFVCPRLYTFRFLDNIVVS